MGKHNWVLRAFSLYWHIQSLGGGGGGGEGGLRTFFCTVEPDSLPSDFRQATSLRGLNYVLAYIHGILEKQLFVTLILFFIVAVCSLVT